MTRVALLIPVTLDELATWTRLGIQILRWEAGVTVRLGPGGPIIDDGRSSLLAKRIPVFEDDLSVLIAQVEDDQLIQERCDGQPVDDLIVPISSLAALYPVTARGRELLEGKLDEPLRERLKEPLDLLGLRERERRWYDASRKAAALVLMRSLGLDGPHPESAAFDASVIETISSSKRGERFLDRLIHYARETVTPGQRAIPNDDSGFLSDLGRILKEVLKATEDQELHAALRSFKDAIESARKTLAAQLADRSSPSLPSVVAFCKRELDGLARFTQPVPPVAALVYLKARNLISGEASPRLASEEDVARALAQLAAHFDPAERDAFALGIRITALVEGFAKVTGVAYWLGKYPVTFGSEFRTGHGPSVPEGKQHGNGSLGGAAPGAGRTESGHYPEPNERDSEARQEPGARDLTTERPGDVGERRERPVPTRPKAREGGASETAPIARVESRDAVPRTQAGDSVRGYPAAADAGGPTDSSPNKEKGGTRRRAMGQGGSVGPEVLAESDEAGCNLPLPYKDAKAANPETEDETPVFEREEEHDRDQGAPRDEVTTDETNQSKADEER